MQIADLRALTYLLEAEIGILDSAISRKRKAEKKKGLKLLGCWGNFGFVSREL
jgi:hypothetical protein